MAAGRRASEWDVAGYPTGRSTAFHLVMLANRAVTAVHQRVTRELLDRRGRATGPPWAKRRRLLQQTGLTNARTEGTNRLIKHLTRTACGFRNRANYRRLVRLHCTRRSRRMPARNPTAPDQG